MNPLPECLREIREEVSRCCSCELCKHRKRPVPGELVGEGRLFLVGEAPGKSEDEMGRPFVGKAGTLLRKTLAKLGIDDVYVTNAVKCRPPGNRAPRRAEIEACKPFLLKEISCLRPRVIVALGRTAASALLGTERSLKDLRGKVFEVEYGGVETKLIVTYHPAAVIRNPKYARPFEEDLRKAWEESRAPS